MTLKNPFDLSGQVAVITGASRGIGKAAAEAMAAMGAKVVVSSRNLEPCEEVAAEIRAGGGQAMAFACNIGVREQCQALIDATVEHFGPVDAMVCNAAVNPYYGPLTDIPDGAFDKIMRSNILSNIWLSGMVIPSMVERGGGTVTIVSSIGGIRGSGVIGAYGMSKAADMSLARSLAIEWGPKNVRVNCVAPGLIKTAFARALWEDPETLERSTSTAPLKRIGTPEEIGGVIAFLASPAASFMTGTTVVADGGVTIA